MSESRHVFHSAELKEIFDAKRASGKLAFLGHKMPPCGETENGWIRFTNVDTIYGPPDDKGRRARVREETFTCCFDPETLKFVKVQGDQPLSGTFLQAYRTPRVPCGEAGSAIAIQATDAATVDIQFKSWEAEACAEALDRLSGLISQGVDKLRLAELLRFRFTLLAENGSEPPSVYNEEEFCQKLIWANHRPVASSRDINFLEQRANVLAPALERLVSAYLDHRPSGEQLYHVSEEGIAACDPFIGALLILDPSRLDIVRRYVASLDREHCSLDGCARFANMAWMMRTPEHIRAVIYCRIVDNDLAWTSSAFLDCAAKIVSGQEFFDFAATELARTDPRIADRHIAELKNNLRHNFDAGLAEAIAAWQPPNSGN